MLPICAIEIDRWPLSPKSLALIDYLRSGGSIAAIHVQRKKLGGFRIRDGRHRLLAYRMLGWSHILARFSS